MCLLLSVVFGALYILFCAGYVVIGWILGLSTDAPRLRLIAVSVCGSWGAFVVLLVGALLSLHIVLIINGQTTGEFLRGHRKEKMLKKNTKMQVQEKQPSGPGDATYRPPMYPYPLSYTQSISKLQSASQLESMSSSFPSNLNSPVGRSDDLHASFTPAESPLRNTNGASPQQLRSRQLTADSPGRYETVDGDDADNHSQAARGELDLSSPPDNVSSTSHIDPSAETLQCVQGLEKMAACLLYPCRPCLRHATNRHPEPAHGLRAKPTSQASINTLVSCGCKSLCSPCGEGTMLLPMWLPETEDDLALDALCSERTMDKLRSAL